MKTSEIEGYVLAESRTEGDGREGLAWSGRFRSDGKIINVLIHYDTDLSEPTDYSYQVAKRDGLVMATPFEKNRKALYWRGFEEELKLFIKTGKHAYEFLLQEEKRAPHFYAVITLARAYEIFNDQAFWDQAVKQIQLAEEEFFKSHTSASIEDLIRLGQAYKVLSRYQASLVQGRSFLSDYKEISALTLIRFKGWRNELVRNNDLHASFFDMELKLLHLLLPELHFETDI